MKESLSKIDRKLIFRETFSSEMDCRANGGVPTNVIFDKGKGAFNGSSSYIKYNNNLKGIYSIRVKFTSYTPRNSQFIMDFRSSVTVASGYIYETPSGTLLLQGGGTPYVNGVQTTTVTTSTKEVIIAGMSLNSILQNMGIYLKLTHSIGATYELFEIYEGTLTAQEVKNLYQNKRYKKLAPHGEILGSELISQPVNLNSGWIVNGACVIDDSDTFTTTTSAGIVKSPNLLIAGKFYKITFNGSTTASSVTITNGSAAGTRVLISPNLSGTFSTTFTFTALSTTDLTIYVRNSGAGTTTINSISLKEYVSKAELVMDIDAFDGVIKNRLSGGLLPNIVVNGRFDSDTVWTKTNANVTIQNGTAIYGVGTPNGNGLRQTCLTIGKTYRVQVDILSVSSGNLSNYQDAYIPFTDGGTIGTKTMVFTAVNTILKIYAQNTFVGTIDNVIVQEVIPSVVNTAVTVVNDGGVKAMRFNGSTSRLDCGSYNGLIGDITINAWVKVDTLGGLGYGRIIDNGQFLYSTNNGLTLIAKNSVATYATSGAFKKSIIFNTILTRTSSGLINFYINGILSSTANQVSSIPVAGGNIYIGNSLANNTGWNGNIIHLQIYNGILSQQEISQLYSSNKSKFNL
jgi:hypothetical protein